MARDIISPLSCVRSYLSIRAVYTIRHTWDFQKPSLLSESRYFLRFACSISFSRLESFVMERITRSLVIFIGCYGEPEFRLIIRRATRTHMCIKWFSSFCFRTSDPASTVLYSLCVAVSLPCRTAALNRAQNAFTCRGINDARPRVYGSAGNKKKNCTTGKGGRKIERCG